MTVATVRMDCKEDRKLGRQGKMCREPWEGLPMTEEENERIFLVA